MSPPRPQRALPTGTIVVDDVWRHYRLVRERNITLKETVLRRRRVVGDDFWALKGVSFDVQPGTALGIIGVNGSGKSTLLKIIAGVLGPSAGSVTVSGSVASLLDLGSGFSPEFTGRENVFLNAGLLGVRRREVQRRMDEIIDFSELGDFIDQPVRTYSSGMQLRLAFSVAVTVHAQIILLDEVLAVGDEAFQRKCLGKMFERRSTGSTIVFVSHDMAAVEMICDRTILLQRGNVVSDGRPMDVIGLYHEQLAGTVEAPPDEAVPDAPAPEPEGDQPSSPPRDGDLLVQQRSWGSGRVVVSGVRLRNAKGEDTKRLLGGAEASIEIDYEVRDPDADDPKFTIRVHNVDGTVLFAVNSVIDEFDPELPRPSGSVRLVLPGLPLHAGRFLLSVGLSTKSESEVYHLLERRLEFSVFAPGPGEGIVSVDRRWAMAGGRSTGSREELITAP